MRLVDSNRIIVGLCLATIVVMLLFPPWVARLEPPFYKSKLHEFSYLIPLHPPPRHQVDRPAGYWYVFNIPDLDVVGKNVFGDYAPPRPVSLRIDLVRLLVQCLAVFGIGGGVSMVMTAWTTWQQKRHTRGQAD